MCKITNIAQLLVLVAVTAHKAVVGDAGAGAGATAGENGSGLPAGAASGASAGSNSSGFVMVFAGVENGTAHADSESLALGDVASASAFARASGCPSDGITEGATLYTMYDAAAKKGNGNGAFVVLENEFCSFGITGIAMGDPSYCKLKLAVNNNLLKWTCSCDGMTLEDGVNFPYKGDFPGCAFVTSEGAEAYVEAGTIDHTNSIGTEFDSLHITKNGKGTLTCKEHVSDRRNLRH